MKYVIGKIFNPTEKKFQSVIGLEFPDAPGYYQFYEIGTDNHFRKRPENGDTIQEIPYEIFEGLYT